MLKETKLVNHPAFPVLVYFVGKKVNCVSQLSKLQQLRPVLMYKISPRFIINHLILQLLLLKEKEGQC
jgi:hypothetical protein